MPVALGRKYVAASAFAPARYGLLSVASLPADSDSRWLAGVEYQPNACDAASATTDRCGPVVTGSATKSPTTSGIDTYAADPFTVYAWIDCGPVGGVDEVIEARAMSALTNGEARAVETVVWTGTTEGETISPHLAENTVVESNGVTLQTAATPVVTGSVDVVEGLGALEGALGACYGGEGVIHVPAAAVAHLAAHGLVVKDGERLRTFYGNRVAVYAANLRHGPTGSEPGAGLYWFYATGGVTVRRGEARSTSTITQSIDRAENRMVYIVERTYVVDWDCCHLAAQINLGGVVTGTVGAA